MTAQSPRRTDAARPLAETMAWLSIAVVGLGGFGILAGLLSSHVAIPFDQPLLDAALAWKAYDGLWNLLSNAANFPMIGFGVGLVLWLFWKRQRREAILVIILLAAVTAGSEGVKQLVHRPRPPGSDTVVPGVVYSFPSGHVLEAVVILGIIAILVWHSSQPGWVRVGLALIVAAFVAAVAVARVAINAHYPSDVLAGFLGGIGALAVFSLSTSPEEVVQPVRDRGREPRVTAGGRPAPPG
jgi:membrane-associated phospholipid phosphatase